MDAYKINGDKCGRDKNGVFHCVCGKCEKLDTCKRENGNDSRDDSRKCGDSGNCDS